VDGEDVHVFEQAADPDTAEVGQIFVAEDAICR
jgi:hypothetical protein